MSIIVNVDTTIEQVTITASTTVEDVNINASTTVEQVNVTVTQGVSSIPITNSDDSYNATATLPEFVLPDTVYNVYVNGVFQASTSLPTLAP